MRIPIREQLGLLVLLTSLIALAVIAIATWVNNYHFVIDIRLSSLSLTASLYANQLRADLILMQSSVLAVATRVIVQNALQRYNDGNNTDANWARAEMDLQSALTGRGSASMLVQARIVSKNGTGAAGPYGLINVTSQDSIGQVPLPYVNPSGTTTYLGDNGTGYPSNLYPNLTFTSTVLNDTFNVSTAYFNGRQLYSNSSLFLGPLLVNPDLALVSVTSPIINNTSDADILGWLTMLVNGSSFFDLRDATQGLGNTGEILIVGPTTESGRLPETILSGKNDGKANRDLAKTQRVKYIVPPFANSSRSTRHQDRDWGQANSSFEMQQYPAVLDAYSENKGVFRTSGSILSTRNEQKEKISSGYALAGAPMVDWLLLVEQSYGEVHEPIDRLRNILLACVFGTVGLLLLLVFPIAHFSVRPIRRLQEATKKTIEPYGYTDDGASVRSSISAEEDPGSEGAGDAAVEARKEGFLGRVTGWRAERQKQKERKLDRRRTFRIPGKVQDRKHIINDELTDLTKTFNEMSEELAMQYERLDERVRERTAQLEISKKAAEAANESKTLFIANISHELKTPLNGILGMCAVCMQEDDQTKIKRSLGIIYKSGDLLLHLLTDLLQFSRNQMGQQLALDEREFRLADISNQILSIFDKQAKDGSINFSLAFQGPQDIAAANDSNSTMTPLQSGFGPWGTGRIRDMMLWGDQHRILQVIINLVSNSLKFTPPGGSVFVRIKCIGENDENTLSRKGSAQSKQSKVNSVRSSRMRGRKFSGSESSTSPKVLERDHSGYSDTALQINAAEPKSIPTVAVHERDTSPPPKGARVLIFEFEVEDTGPGIPEAQQQRVFEPFMQGDLGLSKKYGGTGLGLSICSQLAGLMKGSVKLSSQVGVGSKFTMQIPLVFTKEKADSLTDSDLGLNSRRNSINVGSLRNESMTKQKNTSTSDVSVKSNSSAPAINGFDTPAKPRLVGLSQPFFATSAPLESPNQQMAAIERVAAQASQSGDKVRVLVAEDNKVNQEVVLRMLKLEEIYDVTVAKDGQEAYDLVKASMEERNYFNLIFMDVQMPNLDGLQSTRLIRGMGYSAPIVALTAFAEESNVKECMDSGMDFFLPKPIRRPALKQVLKKYCATIPEAVEPEPEKSKNGPTVIGTSGTSDTPLSPKIQG